jgi:hypothetical protein
MGYVLAGGQVGISMRTVGFFGELWATDALEAQPSLLESIRPEPAPHESEIVAYLKGGHVLIDMMDTTRDAVTGDEWILGASTTLTDGEWLWRQDLAHYVQRHHVRLPDAFLATVRANNYKVPERDFEMLRACSLVAERLLFGD